MSIIVNPGQWVKIFICGFNYFQPFSQSLMESSVETRSSEGQQMDRWTLGWTDGRTDVSRTAVQDVHCQDAFILHPSFRLPWQLASHHFDGLIYDGPLGSWHHQYIENFSKLRRLWELPFSAMYVLKPFQMKQRFIIFTHVITVTFNVTLTL